MSTLGALPLFLWKDCTDCVLILLSPSTLRQANQPSVADVKYSGKRISRKQLLEGEDGSDEDIGSDSEEHEPPHDSGSQEDESDVAHEDAEDDSEDIPSRIQPRETFPEPERPTAPKLPKPQPANELPEPENHDLTAALRATREQDRKKGKAVSQQLVSTLRSLQAVS